VANTLATLGETPEPGGAYSAEREYQQPPMIDWSRFNVQPRDVMLPGIGLQYSAPAFGGMLSARGSVAPVAPFDINALRDWRNIPLDKMLMFDWRRRF